MRKLTICRRKTFVGCAGTLKVYVADDSGVNDLTIEGLPCRFLGKLKNGKTETFEIGNGAARVYCVFDKLSAGYCNDVYVIPEGEEDVSLSGKCKFNPVGGNPFLFDGNDHPDAMKNRNKNSKKSLWIFLAFIVVGFVLGLTIALL